MLLPSIQAWAQESCITNIDVSVSSVHKLKSGNGFLQLQINDVVIWEETINQSPFSLKKSLSKQCPGEIHFVVYYPGLTTIDTTINLNQNQQFTFFLEQTIRDLHTFELIDHQNKQTGLGAANISKLSSAEIARNADKPLAEILSQTNGVDIIKSGPSITKPMINGLSGNRILAMQNGIRLEGQQWANDHGFEMDALPAMNVNIIRGPASLIYGSDALAGVILTIPESMEISDDWKGNVNTWFATNGQALGSTAYLQKGFKKGNHHFTTRVGGRYVNSGAVRTPNYYLQNTAFRNGNVFILNQYDYKKWGFEVYSSYLQHDIGIFSGSQIGNLNDLKAAFASSTPNVPNEYSRKIARSNQQVWHWLNKLRACYHFDSNTELEIVYGFQQNNRKEFDIGLSFNPTIVAQNIPDAYFNLLTHTLDAKIQKTYKGRTRLIAGLQNMMQSNVFSGLEYRAIIPNYRLYSTGIYSAISHEKGKYTFDAGLRYDYRHLQSFFINPNTANLSEPINEFGSFSYSIGLKKSVNQNFYWQLQSGSAWRQPNAYELYGNGLHQGTGTFDFSNSNLKTERSWNQSIGINYVYKKFTFESSAFFNYCNNFIYLNPRSEPVITIAGIFPAFEQKQANVMIAGHESSVLYNAKNGFYTKLMYSLTYGYNLSIRDYLIYTPPYRGQVSLGYKHKKWQVDFSNQYVAKQNNVPQDVDFAPPPPAFWLMNAEIQYQLKHWLVGIGANNLLNTSYRNYLNRFRYFADEMGRNIVFKLNYQIPFKTKKSS